MQYWFNMEELWYVHYIRKGVIMKYICLLNARTCMVSKRKLVMLGGTNLGDMLDEIWNKLNKASSENITRFFLGQEKKLTRNQYMQRGRALQAIIDDFMIFWSKKTGRHLKRKLDDEEERWERIMVAISDCWVARNPVLEGILR